MASRSLEASSASKGEDLASLETLQALTEGEQERGVKDTVAGDRIHEHRILGFGKSTLNIIYPRSNKHLCTYPQYNRKTTNTHLLRGLGPPLLQQLTLPTTTTNTPAVLNTTTSQTPGTPQA
jgi:hypothetical protein